MLCMPFTTTVATVCSEMMMTSEMKTNDTMKKKALIFNSDAPIDGQRPRHRARRGGRRARCLHYLLSSLASTTVVAVIASCVSTILALSAGAIAATAAASSVACGWAFLVVLRSVMWNAIAAHLCVFTIGPTSSVLMMSSALMVTGRAAPNPHRSTYQRLHQRDLELCDKKIVT